MEGSPGFGFADIVKIRRIRVHIGKNAVPYGQFQRLVLRTVAVGQDMEPQDFAGDGSLAGGGGAVDAEPGGSEGGQDRTNKRQGGKMDFVM